MNDFSCKISLETYAKAKSLPYTQYDHMYVDLCDDLVAGILLSKIIYWFGKGKDGNKRVRAEHNGRTCLIKMRKEWWEECRISERVFDRAMKIIKEKGYATCETHRSPYHLNETACFIFLNIEALETAISQYLFDKSNGGNPDEKCVIPELPNGNSPRAEENHQSVIPASPNGNSLSYRTKTIINKDDDDSAQAREKISSKENICKDDVHFVCMKQKKDWLPDEIDKAWVSYLRYSGNIDHPLEYIEAIILKNRNLQKKSKEKTCSTKEPAIETLQEKRARSAQKFSELATQTNVLAIYERLARQRYNKNLPSS